jgi:hypothetical protein
MRQQRGFVLIYALTVLLFLVGTVTGAAYALRLNSSAIYQQREQIGAEFRLRGALEYALAQFALARADASASPTANPAANPAINPSSNPAGNPSAVRPERPARGWRLEAASYPVQIDGVDVALMIEDPGGIADANTLDERMWTDYFTGLGVAKPEQAQRWAAAVMEWKARLGRTNGRGGFTSIEDLMALDILPAVVRYGGWAGTDRPRSDEVIMPGLPDVFLTGTGEKVFDVNRAALPLVAAFTGARPDPLATYDAARHKGKVTMDDAVRILGGRAQSVLQDRRTDPIFRLIMTTKSGASRLELTVLLKRQNDDVQVLAWRLQPLAPMDNEQ